MGKQFLNSISFLKETRETQQPFVYYWEKLSVYILEKMQFRSFRARREQGYFLFLC